MPTQEELRQRTVEIERDSPEALADRIPWWVHVLGLDRIRLLRLLGLSGAEAARTPLTALPRVVDAHEDRAEMVADMLDLLLASFDYDLQALRAALHQPAGPATEDQGQGQRRPGAAVPLPYTPGPRARRGFLLNLIVAGGPLAPRALLTYLSEPTTGDGRRGKRMG
jgi:hypothetical protein